MHLWLRAETKPHEKRSALTPSSVKLLIDSGFKVTVEACDQRIFQEWDIQMVPKGSWVNAPLDAIIIGLKELPEDTFGLKHTHVMFAHCYKNQDGWKDILGRFVLGNGLLYDLEFLELNKRRVAAFGYYAGFAGSAVGLDVWVHRILNQGEYPSIHPYPNESVLIESTKAKLALAVAKTGKLPTLLVMGALGRCGTGACDFARAVGIPEENITKWDMAETAKGGPFPEILEHDIFVNCIYLSKEIPPFIGADMLTSDCTLKVIVDVSCDATNPHNPIPIYHGATTFDSPLIHVPAGNGMIDIVAIDHLPTLLPREASEAFVKDLLPHLLQLEAKTLVWSDAESLFREKVKLL